MKQVARRAMSVDFEWIKRCYIPEDRTLHNRRYENFESLAVYVHVYEFSGV
jgi:hypothetical protein